MREFQYVIIDEIGIHARPAGLLVREAKKFESNIIVTCNDKKASAKSLFGLMGLGAKGGDAVNVIIEGADEEDAYNAIEDFFRENL